MRISGRGQVTIPKPLRERFGMDRDVEVEITPTDHGVLIRTCVSAARDGDPGGESVDALLSGWLKEVNWDQRSAQLHDAGGGQVRLRFGPEFDDEMRRLATEHVEVRGSGRFDKHDQWTSVEVDSVSATGSWREPFDLEAFLNNPNPKIFDPEKVVTIDLPDEEWEAFNSAIREGRDGVPAAPRGANRRPPPHAGEAGLTPV